MKGSIIFMLALVLLLGGLLVALLMPDRSDTPVAEPESSSSSIKVTPLNQPPDDATDKADVADLFERGRSLDEAEQVASQEQKPVLVYATADWCRPCHVMKQTTFADAQVQEAIRERTVPMYLDLTSRSPDTPEAAIARELRVSGIPALILMRDGEELARLAGIVPAEDLVQWIDNHSAS